MLANETSLTQFLTYHNAKFIGKEKYNHEHNQCSISPELKKKKVVRLRKESREHQRNALASAQILDAIPGRLVPLLRG